MRYSGFGSALGMALCLLVSTSPSLAQEEADRQALVAKVNELLRDEAKHRAAIAAGEERTALCSHCHGVDGNSRSPEVPNLASQNPAYLLEQIEKFADGRRKNFVMQSLAKGFTMEDRVNIAVYFSSQTMKPVPYDSLLAAEGRRIFTSVCFLCHGEDGKGEQGYARIAGQRPEYVMATLKRFRAVAQQRVSAGDAVRHNVRMEQVTQHLTDRDIEGLAAYLASLNKGVR